MISIKTQRALRFIPIVNMITLFSWIGICLKKPIKLMTCLKTMLKMFLCLFLIAIIRVAVFAIFENDTLDQMVMYISMYLIFFTLSWFSVSAQEKIMIEDLQK